MRGEKGEGIGGEGRGGEGRGVGESKGERRDLVKIFKTSVYTFIQLTTLYTMFDPAFVKRYAANT